MKGWKRYFLIVVVLLLGAENSTAQPRGCTANFSPWRTCNSDYLSKELVFVGRLVSIDERTTEINGIQVSGARIIVEESLKGSLSGGLKEIYLEQKCRGRVDKNERFIFTADRMRINDADYLVSSRWSTTLKDVPAEDLKRIFNEIRSVTGGIRQPRIIGKVIQYDSTPLGLSGFRGGYLNSATGYDARAALPLKEIEVIAVSSGSIPNAEKQNSYRTKTNSDGIFEFKDVPAGIYRLSPALPEDLYFNAYIYTPSYSELWGENPFKSAGKDASVKVADGPCSEDVRFNVRAAGKIKGKLVFENALPSKEPFLRLLAVESDTQRSDLKWAETPFFEIYKSKNNPENTLEFLYSDLQVGKYILKIIFDFNDEQKNFYYPGVRKIEDAEIINIKPGETKDISFSGLELR